MTLQNNRLGALLMGLTAFIFASQDTIARHLASEYHVLMVLMIRYWFFAAFVVVLAMRQTGGLKAVLRPKHPGKQVLRGFLLVVEVALLITGFTLIGITNSAAVFAVSPLIVAALSAPFLGEKVSGKLWIAIGMGFAGMIVILKPGGDLFQIGALLPLFGAVLFAIYGLLTRLVSREDSGMVSFFWAGTTGAAFVTLVGIWHLEPMAPRDALLMATICVTACLSHGLMIRAYEVAEASAIQPFAYLQLPFTAIMGMAVYNEVLEPNVAIGAVIVVAAGIFTILSNRPKKKRP